MDDVDFDNAHEAWIHALTSADRVVRGGMPELAQLAAQVQEWRRPIAVSANSPFRLCFRLEEPAGAAECEHEDDSEPGDSWYVR